MLTKNIKFKNFFFKKKNKLIKQNFENIKKTFLYGNSDLLLSLSENYQNNFNKKKIKDLKKYSIVRIIGMGGSILGAEAIYGFLKKKIKKKFIFFNNLGIEKENFKTKKKILNLIISKSGNTLETITNFNTIKKSDKSIFITENRNSYLNNLALKMKCEIIEHNNYIGGRYSVLSEVGMLPAELMGLNEKKFKRLNYLIKNESFIKNLINNVSSILHYAQSGKTNSIILNYDENSESLFNWYQQLVAESLGKKSKGILPIISQQPKDNHSVMQLYLDGPKNNFFTFFDVMNDKTKKINEKKLLKSHIYLKNKTISDIKLAQKYATQNIFKKKGIPFRTFEIFERSEESLGELFCFFILETILLGKSLNVNPFDQPSVELIKTATKKILVKN
jgi:glucose-6-phosphate isomerase